MAAQGIFEAVPARVMTAEHLMAIALQTGRAKDHARLVAFVEAGQADNRRLHDILERHHLLDAWHEVRSIALALAGKLPLMSRMNSRPRCGSCAVIGIASDAWRA